MKVALIETIEALVTAIKNKFLTKTEAESIYQPKKTAITTDNISSQEVRSASSSEWLRYHYWISDCNMSYTDVIAYYYADNSSKGGPPSDSAVLHIGGSYNRPSIQAAFGANGDLYTRSQVGAATDSPDWNPWNRMAKASEIPDVSGYATRDWVADNYYNLQEMDANYYNAGDIDDMLDNYLSNDGGTITGSLTLSGSNSKIKVGAAGIYANSWNGPLLQDWLRDGGKKNVFLGGRGFDYISFSTWAEMTSKYLYMNGYIHATEYMKINNIVLKYDPSNNTLNLSGGSGQTVHLAVNGKVIA